MTMNKLT